MVTFLSYGYLDVSVHRVSPTRLWIQRAVIQGSRDQCSFDSFSGLFAAFHALHRHLAPRHPPYALSSLTTMILVFRNAAPLKKQRHDNTRDFGQINAKTLRAFPTHLARCLHTVPGTSRNQDATHATAKLSKSSAANSVFVASARWTEVISATTLKLLQTTIA